MRSVVRQVTRLGPERSSTRGDSVAVEEPLEIAVAGEPLTVTMRTPGDDLDLVAGFLVSEGTVRAPEDIVAMRSCAGRDPAGEPTFNRLDLTLAVAPPAPRAFATTSACGVCGVDSVERVRAAAPWDLAADRVVVDPQVLSSLPDRLAAAQGVFRRTGGLHGAGLFESSGDVLCVREDVGRHNAVDKVVGWGLRAGRLPLSGTVLLVSGRASFELVHKAVMAGVPVLAAVSAPSSLAVDLAREAGLTLIGFLRGETMNVYAHAERVAQVSAAGRPT